MIYNKSVTAVGGQKIYTAIIYSPVKVRDVNMLKTFGLKNVCLYLNYQMQYITFLDTDLKRFKSWARKNLINWSF